ncbi:MAG TPA: glycosyltransferase, partial [Pseudomonadales bacterium]|nr:glycosyltransferase [Pseudomonadales bacterium]
MKVTPYAFAGKRHVFQPSTVHSHPLGTSFPFAAVKGMLTRGKAKLRVDADLFHATDQCIVPMSCPVVATLYDAIPFMHPEWASAQFRSLRNYVKKRVAGFADHVIAISNYCVEEISHYYEIPTDRISVVYCGVDQKWLSKPSAEQVQTALAKRELRAGYFLYVGTLQP